MLRRLFRSLVRKVTKNPVIVDTVAKAADAVVIEVADGATGGFASKVEKAIERRQERRRQKPQG